MWGRGVKILQCTWAQSKICSVRVAWPTHLQNINPESDKSKNARYFFDSEALFWIIIRYKFLFTLPTLSSVWVFRVPILKLLSQNLVTRRANTHESQKIRSAFKANVCAYFTGCSLANQWWRQRILLIADLIHRDLLDFKNPTNFIYFTTDRPTDRLDLKRF